MAEQEGQQFGVAFQKIFHQLQGLSIKLGAQGVNQIIPTFSGDQAEFKNWMKSIEKYAMLTNLEQNDTKLVAYQSSTSSKKLPCSAKRGSGCKMQNVAPKYDRVSQLVSAKTEGDVNTSRDVPSAPMLDNSKEEVANNLYPLLKLAEQTVRI
ncbi:unnamed protein product [Mytilus coruscus]|uniref:Uncharacterized protein n=1 Tax=Mytilus coruscus TaxID=42192 RepID=A0A6J8E6D2_MYTCO|nr:unnamed protein product [Mytilus coruscus]